MTELAQLLERVRQQRQARAVGLAGERHAPPCAEGRLGCTYRRGDRAFDTVSGQEGTVVSSTVENLVVSTARR